MVRRIKTGTLENFSPKKYSLENCIFNIEHAAILVKGFVDGDSGLIRYSLKDKIAEPYRTFLIPKYKEITAYLNELPYLRLFYIRSRS